MFVEWRPVPGRELLGDLLRAELPEIAPRLTTYEVDERYHADFSQNPQLELHEFIAKNVGIRRAAGSYILTTSTDTYLSGDIGNLIGRRMLRPMTVYRATRVDLQLHLDRTNVNESALSDPRNWATVNVLKPPFLTDASGGFLLLDRFSFCALRGSTKCFAWPGFTWTPTSVITPPRMAWRWWIPVWSSFTLGKAGSQHNEVPPNCLRTPRPGASIGTSKILYENPESWGLGDAHARASRSESCEARIRPPRRHSAGRPAAHQEPRVRFWQGQDLAAPVQGPALRASTRPRPQSVSL